jgi:type VI secretion system protein ImpM
MKAMLFGKLPAHGDFVSRGISAEARDTWDIALSKSLDAARGASFEANYGSAPPWRFIRPDGKGWLAGAIALSMDSAGRRFPIVAGVSVDALVIAEAIASECEAALFSALSASWDADALAAALGRLTASQTSDVGVGTGLWWVDGGADVGIVPLNGPLPPTLISVMLGAKEMAG